VANVSSLLFQYRMGEIRNVRIILVGGLHAALEIEMKMGEQY
jgi:hypothetical protein